MTFDHTWFGLGFDFDFDFGFDFGFRTRSSYTLSAGPARPAVGIKGLALATITWRRLRPGTASA